VSLHLPTAQRPGYTSVSLHLFFGCPRFLFPTGIPSCSFLTKISDPELRDLLLSFYQRFHPPPPKRTRCCTIHLIKRIPRVGGIPFRWHKDGQNVKCERSLKPVFT
jgi:hypothetical protein